MRGRTGASDMHPRAECGKRGASMFDRLRLPVFAFLYRNAVKVVDRFSLPPDRVVEIARQIEI